MRRWAARVQSHCTCLGLESEAGGRAASFKRADGFGAADPAETGHREL